MIVSILAGVLAAFAGLVVFIMNSIHYERPLVPYLDYIGRVFEQNENLRRLAYYALNLDLLLLSTVYYLIEPNSGHNTDANTNASNSANNDDNNSEPAESSEMDNTAVSEDVTEVVPENSTKATTEINPAAKKLFDALVSIKKERETYIKLYDNIVDEANRELSKLNSLAKEILMVKERQDKKLETLVQKSIATNGHDDPEWFQGQRYFTMLELNALKTEMMETKSKQTELIAKYQKQLQGVEDYLYLIDLDEASIRKDLVMLDNNQF